MKPHNSLGKLLHHSRRLCFSPAPVFRRTCALLLLALPPAFVQAAQLQEARVSQVIKDVKLLPTQAAPRPAAISDAVRNGTAVRTGVESRAELTFTDQTLARLGANTIFSFNEGTRNLELGGGAMLLRVPKNAGGAQINTAAITAAITGTTIMLEFHPDAYIKFIVLEGTGRIFRKDHVGESVLVHAGQMMIVNPKAKNLPDPVDVDLKRLMETSKLITDFGGLASSDLIAQQIQVQLDQKSNGGLVDTNLVIFGGGTVVSLLDPTNTSVINQANSNSERQPTPTPTPTPTTPTPPPMTPTPTPTKFGTPSVIPSPAPYVIGSGTTIQTDPTITTNGVTDFGKIYRGPTLDGPASAWLFGATSSFDTQIGFDAFFNDPSNVPFAAFKFLSLRLTGNPTISIANGGATELALVSVGDITSGPPGGTLTFSGIDDLLLATQNGSITLTSDLTFLDIPFLAVYARGAGSSLTFDSAVSGTSRFFLASEGDLLATNSLTVSQTNNGLTNGVNNILNISLNAGGDIAIGGDLNLTTEASGVTKGGDIDVTSLGDTTIGGAFNLNIFSLSGTTGNGGNITVNPGGDLNVGDLSFTLAFDVPGVTVTDGANITLTVGGDLNAASLLMEINNSTGGNIGNGGNIFVSTGGDLVTTSGGTSFTIQNTDGTISNGGNLTVTVGGNFTTQALTLFVENYDDDTVIINPAGHIGTGGNLSVTTTGNLTADSIDALINNRSGGTVDSGVNLTFNVGGALTTTGDAGFTISSRFDDMAPNGSMLGSTIGGDATLLISASSVNIGGNLNSDFISSTGAGSGISNKGSTLNGNATYTWDVSGDFTIQGDATLFVLNDADASSPLGGMLHGSATIQVNAANLTAGSWLTMIDNRSGGVIDSDATTNLAIAGNLTSPGNVTFEILNDQHPGIGTSGGSIGGSATINVTANTLSAASLTAEIINTGGTIVGDSNIIFTIGQDLTASNGLTMTLDNSAGGSLSNADISLVTGGNLTANGTTGLSLTIANNSAGHIAGDASLLVSAGGNLTANSITALINNRDGGMIDNGGNLTFNVGGALTTSGVASFVISSRDDGGGGGTITQGGVIVLNLGSVSIGGELSVGMGLSQGGTDAEALATILVSGNLTTGTDLFFDIQNGGLNANNVMTGGLTITNDVLLSLAAANVTTGDFLSGLITNLDGGQIGGSATMIFGVNGDISVATDALWQIINNTANGSVTSLIGSDATIAVTAGSISAGTILGEIFNTGGATIGNDASLAFAVTGAIASVGNATFRIVNLDDGSGYGGGTIGGNASISIAAQSLSAATLLVRINNLGGTIGGNTTINLAIGGALTTTGDATINILGDSLTTPGAAIFVTAASFDIAGSLNSSIGDGTTAFNVGSVMINATNDITVGNQILVDGSVSAGGNISATNGITITGGSLTAGGDITSSAGAIIQSPSAAGEIGTISAGGNIFAAGALEAFYFNTSIIAGGSITASDAAALTLQAGTNMTIGNAAGSAHFINANNITAGGALSLINVGTIQDLTSSSFGDINFTPDPFTLTVNSISGTGPAVASLLFNGFGPDPNFGHDNPGNGGLVTLNLLAGGLTIGSAGDIASIDANGGDYALDSLLGGNGGTVNITATGDVNLTDGNITASSGGIPDTEPLSNTMGNGGTVNVTSSGGTITVASKIEASSDQLEGAPGMPLRRSAQGGHINLTSNRATGVAINVTNTAQLLALLDAAAPGPGGTITIVATGASSTANVQGTVEADRGTVDIHHNGDSGTVNISGVGGTNSAFIRGDIVKIGALGNNGILTIGQGTLSADSMLKLYANGSNGQILFVDNVSIGGGSATIIAGNTVTINDNKIVTVNGAKADVYTGFNGRVPNANYTGFGGNGNTTGTFGGAGANNPQPIANAPPFDAPPGG